MQPDEPEIIIGKAAGPRGEWWIFGARWNGTDLHTPERSVRLCAGRNRQDRAMPETLETRTGVSAAA